MEEQENEDKIPKYGREHKTALNCSDIMAIKTVNESIESVNVITEEEDQAPSSMELRKENIFQQSESIELRNLCCKLESAHLQTIIKEKSKLESDV